MKNWVLYILENERGILYTGITTDVKRRVRQHNGLEAGGGRFTRKGRPWKLLYVEEVGNVSQALKRERQVKQMSRTKKLALAHRELEQAPLRGQ